MNAGRNDTKRDTDKTTVSLKRDFIDLLEPIQEFFLQKTYVLSVENCIKVARAIFDEDPNLFRQYAKLSTEQLNQN